MPAVVLVLACCLTAVQVVGQQVRLTDAAADAARSLARGDGGSRAAAIVESAMRGAEFASERRGEYVCALVRAPVVTGPLAPLATLGVRAEASSCALAGGL